MNLRASILGIAVVPLMVTFRAEAAGGESVTTTVYVGRHFEVRDLDQPVKYVFNGQTRVVRIIGSLSAKARIQRLRLRTGWNLMSLAVTAQDLLGQFQEFTIGNGMEPWLRAVYRWRPSTGEYISVEGGETVAAGTVLWLHVRTSHVVSVRGDYAQSTAPTIPAGGAFVPGPGLEVWSLRLPPDVTVWRFDAGRRCWQAGFAGDLAPLSNIPPELACGEAIYVHTSESVELSMPKPELRIAYYHQDHLGSSSVITDGAGQLAEEAAYYPFGAARHRHRPREVRAHYGFTQKERDLESGLNYFEARYLASPLARFLSFDPMVQRLEALEADELKNVLAQPAKFNPFAYALNNPTRYVDPDGRDVRPRPREGRPEHPEPELTIRIGPSSKRPGEITALSFSTVGRDGAGASAGAGGKAKSTPPDFQITRHTDKTSTELFRKSQAGQPIKSVTLIIPGKDGKEFHIHLTDVLIGPVSVSNDPRDGKLVETLTLNAATVRFGDPETPAPAREPMPWWRRDPRPDQ